MSGKPHVAVVVGARPNFMKAAPVFKALRGSGRVRVRLIHTGQHYDVRMSKAILRDLGLPHPEVNLGVGNGSHGEVTARVLVRMEGLLSRDRPDLVLVFGDVNSTLAAALAAAKLNIPVGHVEAGLRSGDRSMPEELNRICTDHLSDLLFASEPSGIINLRAEGIGGRDVHLVGNCMIDTLLAHRAQANRSHGAARRGLPDRGYMLVTLHRPSNVDDPHALRRLLEALGAVSRRLPVVWPVHPRTEQRLKRFRLEVCLKKCPSVRLEAPLAYLDFLALMDHSRLVLTDSGGIQEETTILGIPCLTLRANTERPITLTQGTNRLLGTDPRTVARSVARVMASPMPHKRPPALWDGRAGQRIARICIRWLKDNRT